MDYLRHIITQFFPINSNKIETTSLKKNITMLLSTTFVCFCFVYICVKHVILKFQDTGKTKLNSILIVVISKCFNYPHHFSPPLWDIIESRLSCFCYSLIDFGSYMIILLIVCPPLISLQHLTNLSAIHNTFLTVSLALMCTWHN
jgi:hypothetical protein